MARMSSISLNSNTVFTRKLLVFTSQRITSFLQLANRDAETSQFSLESLIVAVCRLQLAVQLVDATLQFDVQSF
jgi:hypothetical protein